MKITVESEALDSLKAMVEQLQSERDELLEMAKICHRWLQGTEPQQARAVGELIAKCTAKSDVMT